MRKLLLTIVLTIFITSIYAQEEAPKDGWKKGGTFSLLFNQSSFSNWVAGGENALAGNALVNYNANLLKGDWTWDNKIILAYGMANTESKGSIKTDDRFELNSLAGKKATKNWYYSMFANFMTQFTDGYDYANNPDQLHPISKMFAPAYLSFGPGMLWKKSDDLKINISPATGKITFVLDDTLANAGAFGVDKAVYDNSGAMLEKGKHIAIGLGLNIGAYYKTPIMKNVTMENILNLYSNYLDHPENIDVNHQLNVVMQVNKYISANLGLHTLYDDNMVQKTQFKEVFGVGFNYTF